jgi:hypothetical protein
VWDRTRGQREEFVVGPPDPVVEKAAAFLRQFWLSGDSQDEVRASLGRSVAQSPDLVHRGLAALCSVLADPSKGWCLTYLVEIEANHSLDEFSEAAARAFLDRFVALADEALDRPGRSCVRCP